VRGKSRETDGEGLNKIRGKGGEREREREKLREGKKRMKHRRG